MKLMFLIPWILFFPGKVSVFHLSLSSSAIEAAPVDSPYVKIPHRALGMACDVCHKTTSWKDLKQDIQYDHSKTGFLIKGAHKTVRCSQCHEGGKFGQTIRECSSCHLDPHQGQLDLGCNRCHSESAWLPSVFRHDRQTFVMVGAHRALDCASCHRDLMTFKMPNVNSCGECHRPVGVPPAHSQWEMIGDCNTCHNQSAWDFYPHFDGWFRLMGHHKRSCDSCHWNAPDYSTYSCRRCHDFDHKGEGDHD